MDIRVQIVVGIISAIAAIYGGWATIKASIGAKRLEVGTPAYSALDARQVRLEEQVGSLRDSLEDVKNQLAEDRRFIRSFVWAWEDRYPDEAIPVDFPVWLADERARRGYHPSMSKINPPLAPPPDPVGGDEEEGSEDESDK